MSVTFVSAQTGFALGQVPCPANLCYGLAKTTDAGRSWSFVADLPMPPEQDQPITKVRFADSRNGWVFGPQLWATHDGGVSWRRLGTPARAFDAEASAGFLYVLGSSCAAEPCSTPATLLRAPVGKDSLATVAGAALTGGVGRIALHGKAVWVVTGAPGVGAGYLSSPDGVSWHGHADPCQRGSDPSFLAAIAPVTASTVYLLCVADPGAGSQTKAVLFSTDGGLTARATVAPPGRGGIAADIAAASPAVVAVSAQSGASWIYRSADAGRTWASGIENADGGIGFYDLGFTNATQGVAVYGTPGNGHPSQLLITRDAGATWTPVIF